MQLKWNSQWKMPNEYTCLPNAEPYYSLTKKKRWFAYLKILLCLFGYSILPNQE